jgi:argininosuccinate lyase
VAGLTFDRERMARAVTADLLATDRAVDLAAGGMPFRDAYVTVAREVGSAEAPAGEGAAASIERRTSLGAPGNPGLEQLRRRLDELALAEGSRPLQTMGGGE